MIHNEFGPMADPRISDLACRIWFLVSTDSSEPELQGWANVADIVRRLERPEADVRAAIAELGWSTR